MTYYSSPCKAFTLWTGPRSQAAKHLFPGKSPIPLLLPKRSRDGTRFRNAVLDILSGIEAYEPDKGYRHAWQRVYNLREHFNLSPSYHSWAGGYLDCKVAVWYREKVAFFYIVNGEKVEYSKATQEQKDIIHPRETTDANCGHFWIKSGRAFN